MDWYLRTLKIKVVLAIIQYTLHNLWGRKGLISQVCQVFHMELSSYCSTQIWRSPDIVWMYIKVTLFEEAWTWLSCQRVKKKVMSANKNRENTILRSSKYKYTYIEKLAIYWIYFSKKWREKILQLTKGENKNKCSCQVSSLCHWYNSSANDNLLWNSITGHAVWERENSITNLMRDGS